MGKIIAAVYEKGALHPLEPLELQEHQRVTLTISDPCRIPEGHPLLVPASEWADDLSQEEVSIEEVRRVLSGVRGSLSQAIIDERRER